MLPTGSERLSKHALYKRLRLVGLPVAVDVVTYGYEHDPNDVQGNLSTVLLRGILERLQDFSQEGIVDARIVRY